MVRKGIIIGVAAAVAILGGLYALGLSTGSSNDALAPVTSDHVNQTQLQEDRIASLLGNDQERINNPQWRQAAQDIIKTENIDNALLIIHSDTEWSAVVSGSDFVQESVDGSGYKSIEVACEPGGIFSHVIQKMTESGVVNVYMAQDGRIIKQGNTGAAFGVVAISGNCAS